VAASSCAAEGTHSLCCCRAAQAYYVSNGQLRPANKQYASSSFAYELTLNETTRVELCTDTEMVVTNTHFEFVPLDQLAQRLGSKALLDVLGVVTHVGEMGAVVRKKDNMELKKRELTLLDSTARTVKLTLWDEVAEKTGAELAVSPPSLSAPPRRLCLTRSQALTAPIVAFKAVRLGDYNGVSLSTLNKSTCVLEPAVEAATRLRAWYSTVGATVQTVEAGAGLVGSGGGGGAGGAGRATRKSLSELVDAPLLSPDAKPEWATLHGCVVHIQPDSSLYYCACPEEGCNKKVVQDGGGWLCEATGHRFPECKRRYILRFKAADATCAAWVNAFDDQGRQMFGCSADELHAEKEGVRIACIRASRDALTRARRVLGQCRLPAAPEGGDLEALDHEDQVHH